MIKKLRRRFLLVMISIFVCVVIAILASIFLMMARSEKAQSEQIMQVAISKTFFMDNQMSPNIGSPHMKPNELPKKPFTSNDSTSDLEDLSSSVDIYHNNSERPPNDQSPNIPNNIPEKPENSMIRNTITVETNPQNKVVNISYQISDINDDELVKSVIKDIISYDKQNGVITMNDIQFRYRYEKKQWGSTIVLLDRSIEISTLKRLLFIFIFIGSGSIIVLCILSIFLTNWATKPIATAWEKQKQFVADASHELKTPLTVISANADVVLSNPNDTIKNQSKWLNYIKTETSRMNKLVTDLLYIAKTDANENTFKFMDFNISDTVSEVCLVFECLMFEKHKDFQYYNIEENLICNGDEDRIKQLVTILLDNAIKHSPENAVINVSLNSEKNKKIKLIVSNTGEAIPKESLDKIFERFYRVDKSRARETGGYGLGLSIAKTIVDNHKGTITVSSKPEKGTSFVITI